MGGRVRNGHPLHNPVRREQWRSGCDFPRQLLHYRLTFRILNRDLAACVPHMGEVHPLRRVIFKNCFQIREKITC